MNAVDYHSDIAEAFGNRYQQSPDFQERYRIWSVLLNTYLKPNDRVLDAGCGTGVFSRYAAQLGANVEAIDGSAAMIELAKQATQEHNLTVAFEVAFLPLASTTLGVFDVVLSSSVLEYVPDLHATLQSLDDHLRPNGLLIVSMPNQRSLYRVFERLSYRLTKRPAYLAHVLHYATPTSLQKALNSRRFELIHSQTYGGTNRYARLLRSLLPAQYTDTLFVAIYRKK